MSTWHTRKAKVLLWYWLNFHPAETRHGGVGVTGVDGDCFDPDMSVIDGATNVIGAVSTGECYVDGDSTNWQDINIAVTMWLKVLGDKKRHLTISWLREMKGKPIEAWHFKYSLSESPLWDALIVAFQLRRLLNGDE
jgi:hypothetical protein